MTSVLLVDTIKNSLDSADTVAFTGGIHSPGSVIQMVNSTSSTSTTISSTSVYADITDANVTITPKSTTSKIVLFVNLHIYTTEYSTVNNWRGLLMRVLRGSTEIYGDAGSAYGEGQLYDGTSERWMTYSQRAFVDSPNTTSATTYKCQGISKAGNNIYVNRGNYGAGGTMIAMEIAQ